MDTLIIQGLTKSYPAKRFGQPPIEVVKDLTLSVREGEIFGFLGHNGAGKTTTIKVLVGLLSPTSGHASIMGRPIQDTEVRHHIGYLPESPFFYEYLNAEEFLRFYGELFGLRGRELSSRIDALLDLVKMEEARRIPLRKFSKGMLQRIGIAQSLINNPKLVILDEPMSGLDPIGRRDVRNIILSLRQQGKTVFFSTHILPDVEMICDRVGIMVRGQLRSVGTVQDLLGSGSVTSIEILVEGLPADAMAEAEALGCAVMTQGSQVLLTLQESGTDAVLDLVRKRDGRLVSLVPHKRSLEDLFLKEAGLGRT